MANDSEIRREQEADRIVARLRMTDAERHKLIIEGRLESMYKELSILVQKIQVRNTK